MKTDAVSATAAVGAVALGIPSVGIVAYWLQEPSLYPSTSIEGFVFAVVLIRAALFLGVPRVRKMKPSTLVVLLSGDILFLPAAVGLYFLTGVYAFDSFGAAYLAAWLSSALVVYPLVGTFAVTAAMLRRSRLAAVVPSAAGAFVLSTVALGRIAGASGQGLSSVAHLALSVGGQSAQGGAPSPVTLFCTGLLFASLGAYSFVRGNPKGGVVPQLAVGVAGVVALLGWVQLVSGVQLWLAYGVPSTAVVGATWWLTRER